MYILTTRPPAIEEPESPLTLRHLFIAASSVLFAAGLAALTPDLTPRAPQPESRMVENTTQPAIPPTIGSDLRMGDPF